MTFFSSGL
jgi:predicted nuclease with TOPRIM domain